MAEHKFNDDDFAEAMRCMRSAWHENAELSHIELPSEEAREALVASFLTAVLMRGLRFAKAGGTQ